MNYSLANFFIEKENIINYCMHKYTMCSTLQGEVSLATWQTKHHQDVHKPDYFWELQGLWLSPSGSWVQSMPLILFLLLSPIHCKAYKFVWSTMSCSRDVVKNKWKICKGVGGICTVGPTGSVKAVISNGESWSVHWKWAGSELLYGFMALWERITIMVFGSA